MSDHRRGPGLAPGSAAAEFAQMHTEALTVICPACKMGAGTDCVNLVAGGPLGYQPAHPTRIRLARGLDG